MAERDERIAEIREWMKGELIPQRRELTQWALAEVERLIARVDWLTTALDERNVTLSQWQKEVERLTAERQNILRSVLEQQARAERAEAERDRLKAALAAVYYDRWVQAGDSDPEGAAKRAVEAVARLREEE